MLIYSGKRHVLTEGVILSGTNTDGVNWCYMKIININDFKIDRTLYDFINNEVLPGTDINQENFLEKFFKRVHELSPINKSLLEKRRKYKNR